MIILATTLISLFALAAYATVHYVLAVDDRTERHAYRLTLSIAVVCLAVQLSAGAVALGVIYPIGLDQNPGPTPGDAAGAAVGIPGVAICASAPTSCMQRS